MLGAVLMLKIAMETAAVMEAEMAAETAALGVLIAFQT